MVENRLKVTNGKATYNIPATMGQGIYTIHARYDDDDPDYYGSRHYAPSETENTLIVTKNATRGVINNGQEITTTWFEPYTYTATFTQANEPIVGGTVTFSLGNDSEGNEIILGEATTNSNGTATLSNIQLNPDTIPALDRGTYSTVPLFITLQESFTYNTVPLSTTIKIFKRKLDVSITTPSTVAKGAAIQFKGIVADHDDASEKNRIKGLSLNCKVAGNISGTVQTTINTTTSKVEYSFQEPTARNPGTYTLYVSFAGNKVYEAKEVSKTITVKDKYTIQAFDRTSQDNETADLVARIYDYTNSAKAGVTNIACTVYGSDGSIYATSPDLTSNSKGEVHYSYAPSKRSTLTQRIVWTIKSNNNQEENTAQATFKHKRATKITFTASPESITYGETKTFTFTITDSNEEVVPNAVFNVHYRINDGTTLSGSTVRTKLNSTTLKTNSAGVGTFSFNYNQTMVGGKYIFSVLNDDSDYYVHYDAHSGEGQIASVKIINKPVIVVNSLTCTESHDSSKSKCGTMFANKTNNATFTATVYRNTANGQPFPNLTINEMILNYTIDGNNYTYNLRGDGDDKIPVSTNANGVATLTVPIPCAKFALNNTVQWKINTNTDTGEYHTSTTANQSVKVKRYVSIVIPNHELTTNTKNKVNLQAYDSHADEINQVYASLSTRAEKGSIPIFTNKASSGNLIAVTDYQLPYTTQTIVPGNYYINAWTTNTTDYVSKDYYSSAANAVMVKIIPTISVLINPDYSTNPNNWISPTNTTLTANRKLAIKTKATYKKYVAGTGLTDAPISGLSIKHTLNTSQISTGTTNAQGEYIYTNWTIPEVSTFQNTLKTTMTETVSCRDTGVISNTLKIKKTLLFQSAISEVVMSTRGKLIVKGYLSTEGGLPAKNVTLKMELGNKISTGGLTMKTPANQDVTVTTNSSGYLEFTWDNTINNKYYMAGIGTGKTYYLHMVSVTEGYSDLYGSTPVYIRDGHKLQGAENTFVPGTVTFKGRLFDNEGNPLVGARNISITCSALNVNKTGLTTVDGGYVTYSETKTTEGTYTYTISVPEQTINDVYYSAISANGKMTIKKRDYVYVPNSQNVTSTQWTLTKMAAMVYTDSTKTDPVENKANFKLMNANTGATIQTLSTDANGLLYSEIDNGSAKWYTQYYKYYRGATATENYTESPLIKVTHKHVFSADATKVSCSYGDGIKSPLLIQVADKSYTRGTTAGYKGSYSYKDTNGNPVTDNYTLVGMGWVACIDTTGNNNEADFVTILNGATLKMQDDGYLGTSSQRSWTNTEYSIKGSYDLVLKPIISSWTADQKNKYADYNIRLSKVITIK